MASVLVWLLLVQSISPSLSQDDRSASCAEERRPAAAAALLQKEASGGRDAVLTLALPTEERRRGKESRSSGSGTTAPLDEEGYATVAKTKRVDEMDTFVRRVVSHLGLHISSTNIDGLRKLVLKAPPSLELLEDQIKQDAERRSGWVSFEAHEPLDVDTSFLDDQPGPRATLDQAGLNEVVNSHNATNMALYLRRVASTLGLQIVDEDDLQVEAQKLVDGEVSISYTDLEADIRNKAALPKSWVKAEGAGFSPGKSAASAAASIGATASLDETGYAEVAKKASVKEMKIFTRRLVATMGLHMVNETALEAVMPRFIGADTSDFEKLHKEILDDADRTPSSSTWVSAIAPTVPPMNETLKNMYGNGTGSSTDELTAGEDLTVDGTTASLNLDGFKSIIALKDLNQLEIYIRRVVAHVGLKVASEKGLKEVAAMYLNAAANSNSWDHLRNKIMDEEKKPRSWVMAPTASLNGVLSGATAELNEKGYAAVAASGDKTEMEHFVRRLISDMGFNVMNEGDLDGFVHWYSGDYVQNFTSLRNEILTKAEQLDTWITTLKANGTAGLMMLKNAAITSREGGKLVFSAELPRRDTNWSQEASSMAPLLALHERWHAGKGLGKSSTESDSGESK